MTGIWEQESFNELRIIQLIHQSNKNLKLSLLPYTRKTTDTSTNNNWKTTNRSTVLNPGQISRIKVRTESGNEVQLMGQEDGV